VGFSDLCVFDRVHLLEEQLRETEMRASNLLAEEQRRSRDMIVRPVLSFAAAKTFFAVELFRGKILKPRVSGDETGARFHFSWQPKAGLVYGQNQ